jgi:hypothetical protein
MSTAVPKHRLTLLLMAMVIATFAFDVYASAAQAACSYPEAEQVFTPYEDDGYYQLAPDGAFASGGTGWTLEGGAALVTVPGARGHEGLQEETAVSLPFGATVTSPPVCVDETTPNFRFMMRNQGDKGGKIRVTVSYENTRKVVKAKNSDVHSDDPEEWVPTPSLKLETGDEEERVARISFTAKDPKSAYLVDDVYVDPFARH